MIYFVYYFVCTTDFRIVRVLISHFILNHPISHGSTHTTATYAFLHALQVFGNGTASTWYSSSILIIATRYIIFNFRFRFGHRLFHPVFFLWVLCCSVSVSAASRLAYDMYLDSTYVRWSFVWDVRFVSVIACYLPLLFVFPPEVILRSRVNGACPVTTDCIVLVAMR